jgi:hypothetical protein
VRTASPALHAGAALILLLVATALACTSRAGGGRTARQAPSIVARSASRSSGSATTPNATVPAAETASAVVSGDELVRLSSLFGGRSSTAGAIESAARRDRFCEKLPHL